MEKYNEIPLCPDSLDGIELREHWMECCEDLIERGILNECTIETLKCYFFTCQVQNEIEKILLSEPSNTSLTHLLWKSTERMLECSEILKFTPKDQGLIP